MSLARRLRRGRRFAVSPCSVEGHTSRRRRSGKKGKRVEGPGTWEGLVVNKEPGVVPLPSSPLPPRTNRRRRRRCLLLSPILCIIFSLSFGETTPLALPIVHVQSLYAGGGVPCVSCIGEIFCHSMFLRREEEFVPQHRKLEVGLESAWPPCIMPVCF